jgi:ATP-dependent DNA helicase RecQ
MFGSMTIAPDIKAGRANSARRVAALQNAFSVSAELSNACNGTADAILLVDDLVDTGWTMTLAARALRRSGAAAVVPFALAIMS